MISHEEYQFRKGVLETLSRVEANTARIPELAKTVARHDRELAWARGVKYALGLAWAGLIAFFGHKTRSN